MFYHEPDDGREVAATVDLSSMSISAAPDGHDDEQTHPFLKYEPQSFGHI
jgi:hypothetical protein